MIKGLRMLRFLFAFILAAALPVCATAEVSVNIYGRIDLGTLPPPPVLYPQPILIQPVPTVVAPPPLYLHVPPGHAKNWRKHCSRYNACGQPVYFVQERWYHDVYVPHARGQDQHHHKHEGKGHGREHRRDHCPPGHAKKGWC
jgi:hypothetical protein